MYRVFTGSEADRYSDELIGSFRLRHRVFKERMRWKVTSQDGLERDNFDALNPVYFTSMNEDGEVDGTWRLLPTTGPHMLRDVFRQLLEGRPVPNSPMVWEMSRLALNYDQPVDGAPQGEGGRCTIAILFSAALEFCWMKGIRELVVVHDVRMARITQRTLGYSPTWETKRFNIDGVETTAAQYRIDSPVAFRKRRGIENPVLGLEEVIDNESVA